MELQKNILLFFSGINSPFLNKLVEFITMFGETVVPLVIVLFILWCVDKKKGTLSGLIMFTALVVMDLLKCIVRYPRPWTVIPELQTGRIQTATGYSFPSGHATTASSFYSAVAFSFKKKVISIICAVIILLVPISRLYLCVHWPLDVCCGTVLGIGTTFILFDRLSTFYDNRKKYIKQMVFVGAVISGIALLQSILLQVEAVDYLAFSDFSKNMAMLGGVLVSFGIEERVVDFSTDGTIKQKILRYAVGIGGALILLEGVKLVVPKTPITTFFRYYCTALWIGFYPILGKKMKLFN